MTASRPFRGWFAALGLLVAGCAAPEQGPGPSPLPASFDPSSSCESFVVNRTQPGRPTSSLPDRFWTLIGFDLDGSGHAVNVRVLDSSEPNAFSANVAKSYEQSSFQAGMTRHGCQAVFSIVRRRE
jgi:hypothetical protein